MNTLQGRRRVVPNSFPQATLRQMKSDPTKCYTIPPYGTPKPIWNVSCKTNSTKRSNPSGYHTSGTGMFSPSTKLNSQSTSSTTKTRNRGDWDPFFASREFESLTKGNSGLPMSKEFFDNYPKLMELQSHHQTSAQPQQHHIHGSRQHPQRTWKCQPPPGNIPPINNPLAGADIGPQKSEESWGTYNRWWETVVSEKSPPDSQGGSSGNNENFGNHHSGTEHAKSHVRDCGVGREGRKPENDASNIGGGSGDKSNFPDQDTKDSNQNSISDCARLSEHRDDQFIIELSEVGELIEFIMYKCAAEECLPMLPEILKEVDVHFRSLIHKYIDQKKKVQVEVEPVKKDASDEPQTSSVDINLFKEMTRMQNELESKNAEISKEKTELLGQVDLLKDEILKLKNSIGNHKDIEKALRLEIETLKNEAEEAKKEFQQELEAASQKVPTLISSPVASPVENQEKASPPNSQSFDLLQLKLENETLKLMNTKLKNEAEMNNRLVGIMELNCLFKNPSEIEKQLKKDEMLHVKSDTQIAKMEATEAVPKAKGKITKDTTKRKTVSGSNGGTDSSNFRHGDKHHTYLK